MILTTEQSSTLFRFECKDKENNLFWLDLVSDDNGLMIELEHIHLLHSFKIKPNKEQLHKLKGFINTFN